MADETDYFRLYLLWSGRQLYTFLCISSLHDTRQGLTLCIRPSLHLQSSLESDIYFQALYQGLTQTGGEVTSV